MTMTKEELRKFCAMHYRAAVAREAQGKFFIHRVKAGYHGTSKATRAEWAREERADASITPPKRATRNNPMRRDPNTPKRWAQE
jgi:hypothetical protein